MASVIGRAAAVTGESLRSGNCGNDGGTSLRIADGLERPNPNATHTRIDGRDGGFELSEHPTVYDRARGKVTDTGGVEPWDSRAILDHTLHISHKTEFIGLQRHAPARALEGEAFTWYRNVFVKRL